MRKLLAALAIVTVALLVSVPASAHNLIGITGTCTAVSASFEGFGAADLPVTVTATSPHETVSGSGGSVGAFTIVVPFTTSLVAGDAVSVVASWPTGSGSGSFTAPASCVVVTTPPPTTPPPTTVPPTTPPPTTVPPTTPPTTTVPPTHPPHTPPCVENPDSPKCSSGSTVPPPLANTGSKGIALGLIAGGFGLAGLGLIALGFSRRRGLS